MTDPRIAALAEALPDAANAAIAADAAGYWERFAAAILAALDGWDLVRVDDLGRQIVGLYIEERDEALADIARLRAELGSLDVDHLDLLDKTEAEIARLRKIEEAAREALPHVEYDPAWHALRAALEDR